MTNDPLTAWNRTTPFRAWLGRLLGASLFVLAVPPAATAQPSPEGAATISAEPSPEVSAAAAAIVAEAANPAEAPEGDGGAAESEGETAAGGGEASPGEEGTSTEEAPPGLVLSELLALAANHPLVEASRADLDAAEARYQQALWAPYSNWNFTTMFTFVPPMGSFEQEQARAAADATDVQWDTSILDWGPWIRLGLSGLVPLWTWGKITGLWDAAEAGVEASREGVENAKDQIAFQVRRAYLTLLVARDILYLIDDGRGYIDDAREEIQSRIDRAEGGGGTLDLYKLDAKSAEVDARELQAQHLERVALTGLRLLAGLDESQEIADVPIAPFAVERRPLDEYVTLAERERTELAMLDAAIEAQRAKVGIEYARFFPDLAVALSAGYSYSNVIYDNHNPWLSDPYNGGGIGGAVVLDYPLDFGVDVQRYDEAQAVLRRLEEQREVLRQVTETEVTDAYEMVVEGEGRTEAWDRGRLAAKRWFISVMQGMTLGLNEASDLTDGLVAYFEDEFNYLNAVYDLDVAWARLALATGGGFLDEADLAAQ
ncbi:MAG: TolC family protein [Deltaproteobacteria bacterium]|nr:TolC family protein [Deltaproteobacteria bacterium]